jgi:hypothetical protein
VNKKLPFAYLKVVCDLAVAATTRAVDAERSARISNASVDNGRESFNIA